MSKICIVQVGSSHVRGDGTCDSEMCDEPILKDLLSFLSTIVELPFVFPLFKLISYTLIIDYQHRQ